LLAVLVVAGGRHVAAAPSRVPEVVVRSRDLDGEARIRNEFGEFAISRILKMKMKHHLEELLSTVEAKGNWLHSSNDFRVSKVVSTAILSKLLTLWYLMKMKSKPKQMRIKNHPLI
jgi:hypothetical protein